MIVKVVCNKKVYYSMVFLIFLLLPTVRYPLALAFSSPAETSQSYNHMHTKAVKNNSVQPKPVKKNFLLNSLNSPMVNKLSANGTGFTDAISIPLSNGTGLVAQYGSVNNYLDNASRNELFFEFTVNSSGPLSITISTNVSVTDLQLNADLFDHTNFVNSVASSYVGDPLHVTYFVKPGTYYILISQGFPNSGLFSYIPITVDLTLQQNTISSSNAVLNLFQSNAFNQIQNIFSYFTSTGYVSQYGTVNLLRTLSIPSNGLDPTDPGFYKGIGLSIYGILRAGEFLSSENNTTGLAKATILFPYVNMTYQLFNLANATNNIAVANTNDTLYVNPLTNTQAHLSDNVYMLMGMSELLNLVSYNSIIYQSNKTFIDNLASWTLQLTKSIIDVFQVSQGVYAEIVTSLTTSPTHGFNVYLESMSMLALDLWWLPQIQLSPFNQTVLTLYNLNIPNDINTTIGNFLLVTTDTNTTINLMKGSGIGIGVEYYNWSSGLRTNISTLAGNLGYVLFLASWTNGISVPDVIAGITTNTLRLFAEPNSNLLKEKAYIFGTGTILSDYISAISNTQFILLAQLLQSVYNTNGQPDASQTWGIKAINSYSDLQTLFYNNVDKAIYGLYDNQAKVLVSNDNNVTANRFVANAFLNSILVRLFPVQLNVKAGNNFLVNNYGQIFLDLSQIPQYAPLTWHADLTPFTFQFNVDIPQFGFTSDQTINLADFANFASFLPGQNGTSKFMSVPYIPSHRGT